MRKAARWLAVGSAARGLGPGPVIALMVVLLTVGLGLAWYTASLGPWRERGPKADWFRSSKIVTKIVVASGVDPGRSGSVWTALAREKPDLVLIAGDAVVTRPGRNTPRLEGLAEAYDRLGHDRAFQALKRSVPILPVWGDGDYGAPDAGGDFPLKAEAKRLFSAFWTPLPDSSQAERAGLYGSVIVGPAGQRVQIILLDTRWFRAPLKKTDMPGAPGRERYMADFDPGHTLLGEPQWQWLEGVLKKPAEVRIVVSPIQVLTENHGFENWSAFPRERQRLFDLIGSAKAKGVIFVSGDRRLGAIYRSVKDGPYPMFEMTTGPLSARARKPDITPEPERLGPLFAHANYGTIEIDWARQAVTLELKGLHGQPVRLASVALPVLYPTKPTGAQSMFWTGQSEPPDGSDQDAAPEAAPEPDAVEDLFPEPVTPGDRGPASPMGLEAPPAAPPGAVDGPAPVSAPRAPAGPTPAVLGPPPAP